METALRMRNCQKQNGRFQHLSFKLNLYVVFRK